MEITTENAHLQGESISKKEQELITQLVNIRKEQNQDSCKGVYSKKLNAVIVSLDESNLDLYNIIEPQK